MGARDIKCTMYISSLSGTSSILHIHLLEKQKKRANRQCNHLIFIGLSNIEREGLKPFFNIAIG
jgi:hypothetical protein